MKKLIMLLISLSHTSYASNHHLLDVACFDKNPDCSFYFQKEDSDGYTNYNLYLTNKLDGTRVFNQPETNTSYLSFSLLKIMSSYYIDFSTSGQFPESSAFIFKEHKKTISPQAYLNFSIVDRGEGREGYWIGDYCTTKKNIEIDSTSSPLAWASSNICRSDNPTSIATSKPKIENNNLIIEAPHFEDGVHINNIRFISLDADYPVSFSEIACLDLCVDASKQSRYLGKINNKYKIYLSMTKNGENINGVYLYSSTKKPINLSGKINNDNIELSVSDNKKLTEKFTGKIDKGVISGTWESFVSKKKYPFILYLTPFN